MSLDYRSVQAETVVMTQEPCSVLLERHDPARNMARFYRIEIAQDLFGGVVLIRNWGRSGRQGQERRQWFADFPDAQQEQQAWLRRKLRRGYGMDKALSGGT